MLDENLPAFFLKPSTDGHKHNREFRLSYHGSDPEPAYLLQHLDPTSPDPSHKNCYAAALTDAFNAEILYGEVLVRPAWAQPSLSADEIRRQGGTAAPAQLLVPDEFVVQLYNPDQQVRVERKEGKWGGSDSYEFSLPQDVFRLPSASSLDRETSDPANSALTPRINFVWRKESKLSRDLTCYMTGRSTDTKKKNKQKEADITIGLWRSLRELTVYESNLSRISTEDPKGLEIVLLLSAAVIKDLYFSTASGTRDIFNLSADPQAAARKLSAGGRKLSTPKPAPTFPTASASASQPSAPLPPARATTTPPTHPTDNKRASLSQPPKPTPAPAPPYTPHASSPTPRTSTSQIDAETARLRAAQAAESRSAANARAQRAQADEAEARRLRKTFDAEEKAARKTQKGVDKETERLRRLYGVQPIGGPVGGGGSGGGSGGGAAPVRPNTAQARPAVPQRPSRGPGGRPPVVGGSGLYDHPSASASAVYMSGGAGTGGSGAGGSSLSVGKPKPKKSFWGLRSGGEEEGGRLKKKGSAMW